MQKEELNIVLIGKRIEQLRKEYNISQRQLAEAINVSRKAVSRWESGQSEPNNVQLVLISKVLGTDMKTLIKGTDWTGNKQPDTQDEQDPVAEEPVVAEATEEPEVQIVEKIVEKVKIIEKPVIEYVETPVVKKIVRVKHKRNPVEFAIVGIVCFILGLILGLYI